MPKHLNPRRRNIAAAAVTAALLGAFGVGAYAASQGDFQFDPGAYLSDLGANDGGGDKGYRSNRTDTDADANRHKDGTESDDRSAEEQQAQDNAQDNNSRGNEDAFTAANLQTASGSTAYNVTGEKDGTGVTTPNGNSSNNEDQGSNDNGGSSDGNTATGPVVNPDGNSSSGDGKKDDQTTDEKPSDGGSDNGSQGNGGSSNGNGSNGSNGDGNDTPAPTPSFNPTDNSYKVLPKDPEPKKDDGLGWDGDYTENDSSNPVGPKSHYEITVEYGLSDTQLYQDQALDEWTIFCALSTSFSYIDDDNAINNKMWNLSCDKSDFESGNYPYFRIDDWYYTEDDVEIHKPSSCPASALTIAYSYRFSKDGEWQSGTKEVTPSQSCVFIVGEEKADGTRDVLYKSVGDSVNLLGVNAMSKFFSEAGYIREDGTLDHVLLNWQEAGQPVDWFYELTPGRHVIEAGDVAELPEGYAAKLQLYNMTDDFEVTTDPYQTSCYLQTLFDVDDSVLGDSYILDVPEGIQAVDTSKNSAAGRDYTWSVSAMRIPDSTVYVNVEGPFAVQNAYEVSESNPYLASTANGVLTNKAGTEYLGVPVALEQLDVPAGVESVEVPASNSLTEIHVHSANGIVPTINAGNLVDCKIIVDDDIFDDFAEKNYDELESTFDVELAPASNPNEAFVCSGGMIFSEDELIRVLNSGTSTSFVQIPHTIKAGAFEGCSDVDTIVLFDDGAFVFEDGSLAGGNVQNIVCFSEKQVEYVQSRLDAAGAPDAQTVLADVDDSEEFFYYRGSDEKLVLLSYQGWGIETFDGTLSIDGVKTPVDSIAPRAFSGADTLKWVDLNESVTEVGAGAFYGCSGLEGFFMESEDPIHVGKDAFAECTGLGFWAASSLNAQFDSQENPNPDCQWYCPAVGIDDEYGNTSWYFPEGYDPVSIKGRFNCIGGVDRLGVQPQADGTLVLYGVDDADTPWLALASGFSYEGELVVPDTVNEIFDSAFLGLQGPFTLSWNCASDSYIDSNAFENSGLEGDVKIDAGWNNLQISSSAFRGCTELTSFEADSYKLTLHDNVFAACPSLTSVTLGSEIGGSMGSGVFDGCDSLAELNMAGQNPLSLNLFSPGIANRFNGVWEEEEEAERLRLNVPEGCEQAYIEAWVYPMVGQLSYWDLYSSVQWDLYEESGYDSLPSERDVRLRMAEELLGPENRLRKMMGLEAVDASTVVVDNTIVTDDGYTFKINDDGTLTLLEVPDDADIVDIDTITPEGYDSVIIGAGAFETDPFAMRVNLGTKTAQIESGAFSGTGLLTVELPSDRVPTLKGGGQYEPFDFGNEYLMFEFAVDESLTGDERDAAIEAAQKRYLEAWPRQFLGLTSDYLVDSYVEGVYFNLAWSDDEDAISPSDEGWDELFDSSVNGPFMDAENCLRRLMGLDEITSLDELAYRYDVSTYDPFGGWDDPWGDSDDPWGDDLWGDPDDGSEDGDDLVEIPDPDDGSGDDAGDDLAGTDAPGSASDVDEGAIEA